VSANCCLKLGTAAHRAVPRERHLVVLPLPSAQLLAHAVRVSDKILH